jgi:hypothetical protein
MHVIPNVIPYLLVLVLSTWCMNATVETSGDVGDAVLVL